MADKLADMFNRRWFERLAAQCRAVHPGFKAEDFVETCSAGLDQLALNQRLRRTSIAMKEFLPERYDKSIGIMKEVITKLPAGYTTLVFPDFVGLYGQQDFKRSMDALAYFTKFGSSEFAIRTFLKNDFDKTIKVMYSWAHDENLHLRRLSSEGSRPRLPWSFKLDRVIAEPQVTRPILDALQADNELYVRKSVANHLNDISKFDPRYMLELCASWDNTDPRTAWIIRHASRSLIKKGDAASLQALNFEKSPRLNVERFKLTPKKLKIGEQVRFSFELVSKKKTPQKLAVDYRIRFQKKKGQGEKVFKLREFRLLPGERCLLEKAHGFADLSTRKHSPGEHVLELQVNGRTLHRETFMLLR